MKSWANTYLAGAVSGTALIVAAVVAFVPLVSPQALREWPISGFGVGLDGGTGHTHRGSAAIGGDKPAAPNLNVAPNAGPSVAANSATDAPAGTPGKPGKRRHPGGTRDGGASSLADRAPVVSPASAEGPVARNPGSHSPAGPGAALPAPSAAPSETEGAPGPAVSAGSAERGGADKAPGPSPASAKAVTPNPGSRPPADASRTPGPPASTGVVPRDPDPGQPGQSAARGHP